MKHLIKPGLHKFDAIPWAWVRYTDLLSAVGNIQDGYPVDKMNAFTRLFDWLDQSKDEGRLTVVVYDRENTSFELAHPNIEPGADKEDFLCRYVTAVYTAAALSNGVDDVNTKRLLDYLYVPAGFSNDVLEHVTFEWTGHCPHRLVSRRDYRVGCSDAGCGGEHYCHTVVEEVCDRCGEVIEEQKI